jgi:hypothetical protein
MTAVPTKVNTLAQRAAAMVGLRRAAELIGLRLLADLMGISTRNLRQKFDAERGLSAATLTAAADALERRAAELTAHAAKLRCAAKGEQS